MPLSEAIRVVKQNGLKPVYVWESENYFVFTTTYNNGEMPINNHTFVVNRRTRKGEWYLVSDFPLPDAGEFVRAHEVH